MAKIGFYIWDLIAQEYEFEIPSAYGAPWVFRKSDTYHENIPKMDEGQIVSTFTATNYNIENHDEFDAVDELLDICLILSFLTAKCVTPGNSTAGSIFTFIGHPPDKFIRPRAIVGYPQIQANLDLELLFRDGMKEISSRMQRRKLQLSLCHWISGLTSFCLEEIFIWATIQMDVVKQSLRMRFPGMDYFSASEKASKDLGIVKLPIDFKHMRTDLIHEGILSGKNFPTKSKMDCADIIAKTMRWIDSYVLAALEMNNIICSHNRWTKEDFYNFMPSITLPRSSS